MNRRSALSGAALAATTAMTVRQYWPSPRLLRVRPAVSRVEVLPCESYDKVHEVVEEGFRLLPLDVRGKRVLLKPNMVEYSPDRPINTHPKLIAGVADTLYRRGAASVVVAEGPGHVRDTEMLLDESELREQLRLVGRVPFVDLNFDSVVRVPTRTGLTQLRELWLPQSVFAADVVISMPKIKTHHWAGVTLSLKNLFGVVPGSIYGWPKNILHWQGIHNSIAELAAIVPVHFVVADGIEAMVGNGPLHGAVERIGQVVFANDPLLADTVSCRLLGPHQGRIVHIPRIGFVRPRGGANAAAGCWRTCEDLSGWRPPFVRVADNPPGAAASR